MEDISLHILDVAENSINAGATLVHVGISENRTDDILSVQIKDNGTGIPEDVIAEVLNPFYTTRTTRKIGMGLSLLAQAARDTGGNISVESVLGKGTTVTVNFRPGHIDMKPLGSVADTFAVLIAGNPGIDFVFSYTAEDGAYSFDTREIRSALDGLPINTPDVISAIREDIKIALNALKKMVS